jgi:23S rRNA (cytosine1962-C5)-methyltransferase
MPEGTIIIKPGREKSILRRHPWIFSGAILSAEDAMPGEIVTVRARDGAFLARGYWNPKSQIQVRILTWQDEPIDADWWRGMLRRSIQARGFYNDLERHTTYSEGYRVVNAENDYLPGLIVDRYNDWLVLQALTLHIDQQKKQLAETLARLFDEIGIPVRGIYERSDVDVRGREGLGQVTGLLWGEEPPELVTLGVEKLRYHVDVRRGHKTGFYLDQKPNYAALADLMDRVYGFDSDMRLLNLFSYTGRFGMQGAGHVVNVDSSAEALELARQSYALSEYPPEMVEFVQADVFDYLRQAVARSDEYDVVILDPPKFAHNRRQIDRASRGYKDINFNAFKLVRPGGYLMTFSCSGAISADLFQKIVFGALADSGRQAQIVRHLGPGDDHPVALTFPEGAYLKGLLLRVY